MQKQLIKLFLKKYQEQISLPCKIMLTRYAPKQLDGHDNLPMSMKYVVDAIAEVLTGNLTPGQADSDSRILIEYAQKISKTYGVELNLEDM